MGLSFFVFLFPVSHVESSATGVVCGEGDWSVEFVVACTEEHEVVEFTECVLEGVFIESFGEKNGEGVILVDEFLNGFGGIIGFHAKFS